MRVAKAFNSMRARLLAMLEHRESAFSAFAHDVRHPLTRMLMHATEVKQSDVRELLVEDAEDLMETAEMGIALVKSERHMEKLARVDMGDFLEKIVNSRGGTGEDVSLSGEKVGMSAMIYPIALRRCLENLLDNAVRYGKKAIVSTSLGRSEKTPVLHIDVDDCGPGIPEEMQEEVFVAYYRLEGSRNRQTGGHGLGLCIARNLARQHKGEIHLSNRPEGGLRARLTLPLHN
jgi:signal transduction histidine kinase